MTVKRAAAVVMLALITIASNSCVNAQSQDALQINWVRSPQMATSLARQFHLPILVFVSSDSCHYCRKMEQEVWSNPDIISMVEIGFVPLELNAERDAKIIDALKIRALPTTLLFNPDGKFITGATGYLSTNQTAGLLRAGQQSPLAPQVTQNK